MKQKRRGGFVLAGAVSVLAAAAACDEETSTPAGAMSFPEAGGFSLPPAETAGGGDATTPNADAAGAREAGTADGSVRDADVSDAMIDPWQLLPEDRLAPAIAPVRAPHTDVYLAALVAMAG